MKKIQGNRVSREKETPILHFLWRWKVATTAAIYLRYQPIYNWAPFTAYQRLLKLKEKGLVDSTLCSRHFAVWHLTKAGFMTIMNEIPPLKEEGFLSEAPEHDLYVLAAHYGDWIPKGTVDDVTLITEQELRRQSDESLPSSVPKSKSHRPDGYWFFPTTQAKSLIALEVEINRKSTNDYVKYGSFYNKQSQIDSVLWIVQSENLARKITNAAQAKLVEYRDIHNFILFTDFSVKGWDAVIFMGPAARSTIRDFLNRNRLKQVESIPKATLKRALVSQILDERLCRFKTDTCVTRPKSDFR